MSISGSGVPLPGDAIAIAHQGSRGWRLCSRRQLNGRTPYPREGKWHRKYRNGKNSRAQRVIPKELRFQKISVSKTLAEKSSRVMGKAERRTRRRRVCEGEMKLLKRTHPLRRQSCMPGRPALQLSAAAGSPQEDRSQRGRVRVSPGPADSWARPDRGGPRTTSHYGPLLRSSGTHRGSWLVSGGRASAGGTMHQIL